MQRLKIRQGWETLSKKKVPILSNLINFVQVQVKFFQVFKVLEQHSEPLDDIVIDIVDFTEI